MRPSTLLATVALVALTASCGGDSAEETAAPAAPATSAQQPAGDTEVLLGLVGVPDDPDAFEIYLTDETGVPVEEIPAGTYEIRVTDLSEIHNFHLEGEGVDETTTVPETGEATWQVTFEPGEYRAVCDPHPAMVTEFTVT